MGWILCVKLLSGDWGITWLSRHQQLFRQFWLGTVRHHVITWANVDPYLWRHYAIMNKWWIRDVCIFVKSTLALTNEHIYENFCRYIVLYYYIKWSRMSVIAFQMVKNPISIWKLTQAYCFILLHKNHRKLDLLYELVKLIRKDTSLFLHYWPVWFP